MATFQLPGQWCFVLLARYFEKRHRMRLPGSGLRGRGSRRHALTFRLQHYVSWRRRPVFSPGLTKQRKERFTNVASSWCAKTPCSVESNGQRHISGANTSCLPYQFVTKWDRWPPCASREHKRLPPFAHRPRQANEHNEQGCRGSSEMIEFILLSIMRSLEIVTAFPCLTSTGSLSRVMRVFCPVQLS